MRNEDFKDVLISQYLEVLNLIIKESELKRDLKNPYCEMDKKIRRLMLSARVDGLDEMTIWDLVKNKIPDYGEKTKYCCLEIAS